MIKSRLSFRFDLDTLRWRMQIIFGRNREGG